MRSCGECTECCVAIPVGELNKGTNEECPFRCVGGCGVYQTDLQPPSCQLWHCAWLGEGIGSDDDRPDKSGIIVYPDTATVWNPLYADTWVIESRPGTLDTDTGRRMVADAGQIITWQFGRAVVKVAAVHVKSYDDKTQKISYFVDPDLVEWDTCRMANRSFEHVLTRLSPEKFIGLMQLQHRLYAQADPDYLEKAFPGEHKEAAAALDAFLKVKPFGHVNASNDS